MGQRAIKYITKADLPKLEHMGFWDGNLTDASLQHYSKFKLPHLQQIWIGCQGVSPQGLAHLEGGDWKLTTLWTSFQKRLSIGYFSGVLLASGKGKVEFKIQ